MLVTLELKDVIKLVKAYDIMLKELQRNEIEVFEDVRFESFSDFNSILYELILDFYYDDLEKEGLM